jgi:hypothetical protein
MSIKNMYIIIAKEMNDVLSRRYCYENDLGKI